MLAPIKNLQDIPTSNIATAPDIPIKSAVPKSGCLIIEEVIDTKGNNIINKIKTGDRFITPYKKLDAAKKRYFYTPKGKKKL